MKHAMISVDRNIAASWRNESAGRASNGTLADQRIRTPKLLMQIHDELIYEIPGEIGTRSFYYKPEYFIVCALGKY